MVAGLQVRSRRRASSDDSSEGADRGLESRRVVAGVVDDRSGRARAGIVPAQGPDDDALGARIGCDATSSRWRCAGGTDRPAVIAVAAPGSADSGCTGSLGRTSSEWEDGCGRRCPPYPPMSSRAAEPSSRAVEPVESGIAATSTAATWRRAWTRCSRWDSNPDYGEFKSPASADWATGARRRNTRRRDPHYFAATGSAWALASAFEPAVPFADFAAASFEADGAA